ncbi:hypothetical protein U1Q18_002221 [Sarracenia purpurea var. burkii]
MSCVGQLEPFVGVDSLIRSCFCCSDTFIADHISWLHMVAPITVACGLMLCSCSNLLLYMPCFAPSLVPIYVCFCGFPKVPFLVWNCCCFGLISLLFGVTVSGLFGASGAYFAVVCGCFLGVVFCVGSFVVSFHLAPPAT